MIILLPVTRSSFWPKVLGMSYERAVLWHRVASTFTLFVTGMHGIHMVHDYGLQESFSAKSNCFGLGNIYGTLILGAGGLLLVLSQAPVRRYSYRTFSMAHKVLVPAVLVLSCLHISNLIYFLLAPVTLEIVCNRIGRKIHYQRPVGTAVARIVPDGVVELRLRAPAVVTEIVQRGANGLGSWVWLAVAANKADNLNPHPFSVAAVDASREELKLLIKIGQPGSWTSILSEQVKESGPTTEASLANHSGSVGSGLSDSMLASPNSSGALEFNLDGPYGKPTICLQKCSTLVLIGGGIGVTPLLPILNMAAKSQDVSSMNLLPQLRRLVFVWAVRRQEAFECAAEELRCAAARIAAGSTGDMPSVEVRLHLTGEAVQAGVPQAFQHTIECRRPDMAEIFSQVKAADDDAGGAGTMGFVCGPAAMIRAARQAGWEHGVPIHVESFDM
jgi:NAD(P)H-flavin reductase